MFCILFNREVAVVLAVVLVVTARLHHLVQVCLEKEMSLVDSKTMDMEELFQL